MKKNIIGFISLVLIFALVVVGGCAAESEACAVDFAENGCVAVAAP